MSVQEFVAYFRFRINTSPPKASRLIVAGSGMAVTFSKETEEVGVGLPGTSKIWAIK